MATYTELATLRSNPAFIQRVEIAVAKFAKYILDESPATPNHTARFRWAQSAIVNPTSVAFALATAVVLDGTIQDNLETFTDAQLQSAVEVCSALLLY